MRTVKSVTRADKVNMGGIIIDQPLPTDNFSQVDPFLLIHHWYQNFPGGRKQKEVGVGPHPHRGFSPVTLIFKGALHHRDSLGNSSIVQEGGVQWMNVGKGITHSERPSKEIAEEGGEFEIIQFWVNVPSDFKMLPAKYYPLEASEVPTIELDDNGSVLNLIAGHYNGKESSIETHSPLLVATVYSKAGSNVEVNVDSSYSLLVYQLNGRTEINGKKIGDKTMLRFDNDGEKIQIESLDDSRLLILAGKPIDEEVTSYGPFVMNSTTEIMEAIRDAQQGKMGVLIEEFS